MEDVHYYHLNRKRRSVVRNLVALQGLRYYGLVGYLAWTAVYYSGWSPVEHIADPALNLTFFGVAVAWYWYMGHWYREWYGAPGGSVPKSFREFVSWSVAVAMMCSAVIGAGGLVALLVTLATVIAGAVAMGWMLITELLGRRHQPHWQAAYVIIYAAAAMHASSAPAEHVCAAASLGAMSVGLAIGCSFDHRKLTRAFTSTAGGGQ